MRPIDEAKLIIEYMNDEIYGLEYSDYDKYCAAEHIASVLEKRDARITKLEAALKESCFCSGEGEKCDACEALSTEHT